MSPNDQLAQRLAWAEWRLQWAEWRIAQLERRAAGEAPVAAPAGPEDATAHAEGPAPREPTAVPGAPLHVQDATNSSAEAADVGAPVVAVDPALAAASTAFAPPPPPPAPAPAPATPATPFDWENLIGVRLFAWLGGAALFVGAALFLNYSIQQNLIPPAVRVALALVGGAAALLGGDMLRAKADRAGQAISGAGVAILYAALFAARSLYDLIPSAATFAGMVVVTAVAGVMAVRRDAFMLAILGLLGGFLTPYLVSTGEDRPLALLGYVALLDAGVVVVASKKRWPTLAILGLAGTSLLYFGWSTKFLTSEKAPYALVAAGALAGVFAFTAPRAGATGDEKRGVARAVARVTACAAAVLPLLLAVILSSGSELAVAPAVLVPYLVLLSAGAWLAGRRVEVEALPAVAAFFCAVTVGMRVDGLLFPDHRVATLAWFAVVPVAYFAAWAVRRSAPEARALRTAAAIALVGAPLLVVTRVTVLEGDGAPIVARALYALVHVALLVAMSAIGEAAWLTLLALGSWLVTLLVLSSAFEEARLAEFLPAVIGPMIAFAALPLATPRLRAGRLAWLSSALALTLHFPFVYAMTRHSWGAGALGAASVACGLFALGLLAYARRVALEEDRDTLTALLGGVALLFFTSAFPILLSNEWLTVAWALEAAALAWLRRRVKHPGLLIASGLLGAATFVRLLVNPAVLEYHARSGTPVLNWWLYTYGVSALALLAAARLFADDELARRVKAPALFATAAGVLAFVLLNIEIADAHSTGESVTFAFSGGGLAQDMTYTLAWLVFAMILFVAGIVARSRPPRIWALALFGLSAAKATMHDLWALGSLYRVAAIVGLAMALLAVSFLTQRFVLQKEPS
jgi:uncharacterized membrane protein